MSGTAVPVPQGPDIDGADRSRRRVAAICMAVLLSGLVAVAVVALTVATPLQEVSFRWVGLAGVSLPVTVAVAVLCTAAAVLWSWSAPPRRGRGMLTLLGLGVPWAVAVALAWPTLWGLLAPDAPGDGGHLSVLTQNLWYENPEPAATARAVLAHGADVVVLVEYTPEHAAAFARAGVASAYPYRWEDPGELGGGLAVMSKVPLGDVDRVRTWSGAARVTLDAAGGPISLYAVHPVSPSDHWGLRRWQDDYRSLTAALRGASPDTVVAGDFNATRAHGRFRKLLAAGGLRDAQDVAGGGFAATWPSGRWFPPLMRLDHVLVGSGVGVSAVEVLPDVGADHRGVLARLRVPRRDAAVG